MSKKKILVSGILTLVVVILIIASIIINKKSEEESEPVEDTSKVETTFEIDNNDTEKIVSIKYDNEYGSFEIDKDNNGLWELVQDKKVNLNQYKIASMLDELRQMKAVSTASDNLDDKKKYGLDKPNLTIAIISNDGNSKTYYVGMENEALRGYYLNIEGKKEVYFVRIGIYNAFDYDIKDIINVDEYQVVPKENLKKLTISRNDKEYIFNSKNDDAVAFVGKIKANDCAAYGCKKEELIKYGLDSPCVKVKVEYTQDKKELEYIFFVGKTDDATGEYYTMQEGSNMVCTMNASLIESAAKLAKDE